MSTLTILKPQTDGRRASTPTSTPASTRWSAPRPPRRQVHQPEVAFETVFDLDYGQPVPAAAPRTQKTPRAARRIRVAQAKPQPRRPDGRCG